MRDPTIPAWPDTFGPRSMSVTIDRPAFKGPKPLDGREQVVFASAGGWLISYEGIPVYSDRYRQFRPIWFYFAAFSRPMYVKPDYTDQQLARRNNISPIPTTFSDTALFSDGSRFIQSTGDCILAANAARGATTISVTNSTVSPVAVGDYIELNGRLHVINAMSGSSWDIWPPLRASYPSGTVLEIDDPRLLVYMTTDSRGQVMQIDARAVSYMNVEFIEANW